MLRLTRSQFQSVIQSSGHWTWGRKEDKKGSHGIVDYTGLWVLWLWLGAQAHRDDCRVCSVILRVYRTGCMPDGVGEASGAEQVLHSLVIRESVKVSIPRYLLAI